MLDNNDFVHLHLHSEYSQLDGFGSVKNYVKRAKELEQKALTITDHGNIDGAIQFQNECKQQDIKSIIGCEFYIVSDAKIKQKEKRNHITILIKNQEGWHNVCQLLTYANLEGFYYRPRIDYESLLKHCEGLVILTGCCMSFLTQDTELIFFKQLYKKMKDDLYLEIMPLDILSQKNINKICRQIKLTYPEIKMVATTDCHYINEDDFEAQQVLLAVQSKAKWSDPNRWSFTSSHLKSVDEMIEAFKIQKQFKRKDYEEAIYNTIEVANKCSDFKIEKREVELPKINIQNGSSEQYLKKLCFSGFKKIFERNLLTDKIYYDRFIEEFDLICKKNFVRYFLIVKELIDWCKENNIMTGDRGSVGGCLITFLIGITSTDPIKFNLLFSRFISEERRDLPDIDIDFEDIKREQVRQHLIDMYGENNIAGVSTFQRMKGRAAIRDVARVFDIPLKEVDKFAKGMDIAVKNNEKSIIERAVKEIEGRKFYNKYSRETNIAIKLEGTIKSSGSHAAAVLISSDDLSQSDRCNLAVRSKKIVINWEMQDCEYMGLMKLDVLGLSALSVLNETKRLVKENHNINIDFNKIDLNDKKVLSEFAEGNNVGCHQFHCYGITKLCKELKIDSFDMLVHVNALYRPGPLQAGMIDEFIKRKNGEKWGSISKKIDEITKDTFGIIVYQEQVMLIANKVAGMSWSEADKIRKVIGKSKGSKELHKFKKAFVDGCIENKTLSKEQSSKLWDNLETFGGYGFCRAHSIVYSRLGYWGQFLKVYYPEEFICASLGNSSEDRKNDLVQEAYRLGLKIILPKSGISDSVKWITKDKKLYAPFIEIKGIGEKAAEKIKDMKLKKPNIHKGFFQVANAVENNQKGMTKIDKILDDIGAFNKDEDKISLTAQQYFSFKITSDPKIIYNKNKKELI